MNLIYNHIAISIKQAQSNIPNSPFSKEGVRRAVAGHMRPELLNRIQEVVVFQPLSRQAVDEMLGKFLSGLNLRLAERDRQLELDPAVGDFLVERGVSLEFGARHLAREFDRWITHPLSNLILEGKFQPCETVYAHLEDQNGQAQVLLDNQPARGVGTMKFH